MEHKLVDEDQVPGTISSKSEKWVELFKSIPSGKAMVTTEKEIGLKAVSVSSLVRQLIKRGLLPPTYKVARRKKGSNLTIYIINSAKTKANGGK